MPIGCKFNINQVTLNSKSDLHLQAPSLSSAYLALHSPVSHFFKSVSHFLQFEGHAVNRKEVQYYVHITAMALYNAPRILTTNLTNTSKHQVVLHKEAKV